MKITCVERSWHLKFSLRARMTLLLQRLRFRHIQRDRNGIRLLLNRTHKRSIRAIKYFLTFVGLISSFFAFQSVWLSFLFGLGIYSLSSLIERIAYYYSSLFVHPLPEFDLDPEKWIATSFGYAVVDEQERRILSIGLLFADQGYATNIYRLLLSWAHGNFVDRDDRIAVRVVVKEDGSYILYCFPSLLSPEVERFHNAIEQEEADSGDTHHRDLCALILGKRFEPSENSHLPKFRTDFEDGMAVLFNIRVCDDSGIYKPKGVEEMVIFNVQIHDRNELPDNSIEAQILSLRGE